MKLQLQSPRWREKRHSVRLPVSGEVSCRRKEKVTWLRASSVAPFSAVMTQPSMFGLRLETEAVIEKGEQVVIKLDSSLFGGVGEVQIRGTVAWEEPATEAEETVYGVELSPNKMEFKKWAALIRGRIQELDPTRKGAELDVAD